MAINLVRDTEPCQISFDNRFFDSVSLALEAAREKFLRQKYSQEPYLSDLLEMTDKELLALPDADVLSKLRKEIQW